MALGPTESAKKPDARPKYNSNRINYLYEYKNVSSMENCSHFHEYSESDGFVIRFDSLNNLSRSIEKIKLEYCIQHRQGPLLRSGATCIYEIQNYSCQKLVDRIYLQNIHSGREIILYIELKAKLLQSNHWYEIWTLHRLFDESNQLVSGSFKLPFYPFEVTPQQLLDSVQEQKIKGVSLHLRISLPYDNQLDSDFVN